MKGLLRNFVPKGSANSDSPNGGGAPDSQRYAILDEFEQTGLAWIWATDEQGHISYLSQSALDLLSVTAEHVSGRDLIDLLETDTDNPKRTDRSLLFTMTAKNRITDLPVRVTNMAPPAADGRDRWWMLSGIPRYDAKGNFCGYRGTARDCSTEYLREREELHMSDHDSLTGLFNRHRMERRLDILLPAYKAASRSCAVMMLDLDRFKHVNDTMGHQAGDNLLQQVAERLKSVVREQGEVGRLGGDEFLIIFPDIDDRGRLVELSEQIINVLTQPFPIDDKHANIGTSVGISIAPYDGLEREDIVSNADLALYAAKNGGRGVYRFYTAELTNEKNFRADILGELRDALAADQLAMHYQPVVRIEDGIVASFEALMRWAHPDRGDISPSVFIPIAEEFGLIGNLGEWALRRACEDAAKWPETVNLSVNVSPAQLRQDGFLTCVANALAHSGLSPKRLELEVTESIFLGDAENIETLLASLKSLGVRLALDDFGTGYSSLSYLRAAPFDRIKVDKSFVDSCTLKGQNSAKIIAAIIGLSNALGMEIVVEGVEAFDQLELVQGLGAKLVQGWIYAKAMPQDTVMAGLVNGIFHIIPEGPKFHREGRRAVYRRIALIHEDHCYQAVMRDLSATGANIEGLLGVEEGAGMVLDLGGGQLVVCTVRWAKEARFGVEFEMPLVKDGAGGLCTRYRVSPYVLASAGMPLGALPPGDYKVAQALARSDSVPKYMEVNVAQAKQISG